MEENYPSFDSPDIKHKYSKILNNLFEKNGFHWWASPSVINEQISIWPKDSVEWEKFPSISKINIQANNGVIHLGIKGSYLVRELHYRDILEEKGYFFKNGSDLNSNGWLIKPLDKLGSLVKELKDIESILSKE
jgi:hypothetical protein